MFWSVIIFVYCEANDV